MADTLFESDLESLPLVNRGKVRDIYAVGDDRLLIVTSDRLSAFDVVLPTPISGKGEVLTEVVVPTGWRPDLGLDEFQGHTVGLADGPVIVAVLVLEAQGRRQGLDPFGMVRRILGVGVDLGTFHKTEAGLL